MEVRGSRRYRAPLTMDALLPFTDAGIALIKAALADVASLREQRSPAHDALKLAIWSDRKRIDSAEVRRLNVLWGRHFA